MKTTSILSLVLLAACGSPFQSEAAPPGAKLDDAQSEAASLVPPPQDEARAPEEGGEGGGETSFEDSPEEAGSSHSEAAPPDGGNGGTPNDGGGGAAHGESGGGGGSGGTGTGGGGGGGGAGQEAGGGGAGAGGSGGSGGTHPDGGSSESGTSSCASLPLCDNFDTYTAGAAPPAPNWTLVLDNATSSTDGTADGGLQIQVDTSQSHSAPNSVRVAGGDSNGAYFVNTSAFASIGTGDVYARFWVMFSGPPTPSHNDFLSMYTGPAQSSPLGDYSSSNNATGASQLRLGFQGNVIVWNYLATDSTLPNIDSAGEDASAGTPTMQWSCIEFHLDQTNANIEFKFQADGSSAEKSISGLSWDGTSTTGVSSTWASSGPTSLALQAFGLGWLHLNNQYIVWFDDVALSKTGWVGCD